MQILQLIMQDKKSLDLQILTNQWMSIVMLSASTHKHVIYLVGCQEHIQPINILGQIYCSNDVTIPNVSSEWLVNQVA